MYRRDSEEARMDPLIIGFMKQVDNFSDQGVLEFDVFKTRPFMKFWPNCIISRYETEIDDYRFVFCGTGIAKGHRGDITGKLLYEIGLEKTEQQMRDVNHECMTEKNNDFSSGQVDDKDMDYKIWHHAKIPLRRNGTIIETLTYITYDFGH